VGACTERVLVLLQEEMASTSKIEMEMFLGTNFELWKLKMEDVLVDRDLWARVSGSKPTTSQED